MQDKALKWLKEWEGLINRVDFAAARHLFANDVVSSLADKADGAGVALGVSTEHGDSIDLLSIDPERPTVYSRWWSHQLGGRGAGPGDLVYHRCFGAGAIRPRLARADWKSSAVSARPSMRSDAASRLIAS